MMYYEIVCSLITWLCKDILIFSAWTHSTPKQKFYFMNRPGNVKKWIDALHNSQNRERKKNDQSLPTLDHHQHKSKTGEIIL